MGVHGAGVHSRPPSHTGFHAHRPAGARYWGRPGVPPHMAGALRDWYWVDSPWNYTIDGDYYYGEGYYFDGYNYCYNGGFHLVPPPIVEEPVLEPVSTVVAPVQTVVTPVAQPVVQPAQTVVAPVVQPVVQPVQTVVTPVAQPVVQPVTTVVTPPPPPPPPPPRRGGLLDVLFGN